MTDIINDITGVTPSTIELSFSWSPASTYSYTAPNSIVITGASAKANTQLTFTPTVTILNNGNDISGPVTLTEYRWDFGDGIISYGAAPTHTYKIINFQARTVLRVTDSQGRQWFAQAQMYLYPGDATGLSGELSFTGSLTSNHIQHFQKSLTAGLSFG